MWWRSSLCQRPVCSADSQANGLGKEVKMGPVQLPPEVWEAMRILKDKIQSAPVLVFPDFDKPVLLETEASKEGLGAVLSQKQDYGAITP